MGDNESVMQFSNRVLQLASTLKSMDVAVDESETSMALLNGQPEEYAPLITAMDTMSGENEVLKFDYVKSRVMQEEQRITIRTSQANAKSEATALATTPTPRPPRSNLWILQEEGTQRCRMLEETSTSQSA